VGYGLSQGWSFGNAEKSLKSELLFLIKLNISLVDASAFQKKIATC